MLISAHYRDQQAKMHADTDHPYGVASAQHAAKVASLIDRYTPATVLDYGCGSRLTLINTIAQGRLCKAKFDYRAYDPAVEHYAATPETADMVCCIDVLEHIEPNCLGAVFDDLKRVTGKLGYFSVSCMPAGKTLPDGRNAHLIVEPPEWWLPWITDRFLLQTFQRVPGGFVVLVSPVDDATMPAP